MGKAVIIGEAGRMIMTGPALAGTTTPKLCPALPPSEMRLREKKQETPCTESQMESR